MEGVPRASLDGRASLDVRVSLERPRVSIEERRGGGATSFEYARRARQSADIKRSAPIARTSNDIRSRVSLDPELFNRGSRKDWSSSQKRYNRPLTGCNLLVHVDSPNSQSAKLASSLGAVVLSGFSKDLTHLVTSEAFAANPDDEFVQKALKQGLWIVREEWIVQCDREKARVVETAYLFDVLVHRACFEDLIHEATISKTTVEQLNSIEKMYQEEFRQKALYAELTKREGRRVLKLLASLMGEKTESIVSPRLTDVAKRAFELFFLFVRNDLGFQRAVQEVSVTELARLLKLERHLEDPDSRHQQVAVQMVLYVSSQFPRFESLKVHLRSEAARQSVDLAAAERPVSSVVQTPRTLPPEGKYYDMEFDAVVRLFQTDFEKGLSSAEATVRLERYGYNDLPQAPPVKWYKVLLLQFLDFLMIVLMIVGVVSLGLQKWIELSIIGVAFVFVFDLITNRGGVLWAVVIANAFIGFYQEMKAERQLSALKNLLVATATVIRDGANVNVAARLLVPGDVVVLQEGTSVPADMRLGEAQSLRILEAQLTGENEPIKKVTKALLEPGLKEGDQVNMAFMSTNVNVGDGKGIVVATGTKTAIGQISKNVASAEPGPTKLQMKLRKLGIVLLIAAVVLCTIILGMSFLWMYGRGLCTPLCPDDLTIDAIQTAVALAVSVIPEGLVAIFTICMAMGASRMAQNGAIVRRLASVETLGSVTTICSDKTGTLTVGLMKQENLWIPGELGFFITGDGIEPKGEFLNTVTMSPLDKTKIPACIEQAMLIQSLCNGSSIAQDEKTHRWKYTGDPTEVALLVAAYKLDRSQVDLLAGGWQIVGRAPFDSNRKRMSVIVQHAEKLPAGSKAMVLSKGAPEPTLRACTHIMLASGEVVPVSDDLVKAVDHQSGVMADEGLRVLGLAYSYLGEAEFAKFNAEDDNSIEFENHLVFCGLTGLLDPPRAPVARAVAVAHGAGIRVVMITGDHPRTALAIAKRLGIAVPSMSEKQVLKGKELDAMSEEELATMDPFPTVFARVSPEDKMKIVHALQSRQEVVSMTGDGVNDAPAIRHADVGVAMGITGTDLTKEAADIVLTDDNFTSIIRAVAEGRRIMDNIILFLVYLLACNSGEIWTMLACVAGGLPSPFTGLQILWGNLIIDSPPSLALGVQPAAPNVLTRLPRNPDQGIFTMKSGLLLLLQGISLACLSVTLFVVEFVGYGISVLDPRSAAYKDGLLHAQGHTFITISVMQLSQGFAGRSLTQSIFRQNLLSNKYMILGVAVSFALLVACMYIPGWNTVFDQYPMNGYDWIVTFGFVVVHLSFVELLKFCLRHDGWRKSKPLGPMEKEWYLG